VRGRNYCNAIFITVPSGDGIYCAQDWRVNKPKVPQEAELSAAINPVSNPQVIYCLVDNFR